MVTREQLAKLRLERSRLDANMQLTPNNPSFGRIVSEYDTRRERTIHFGECSMQDASNKMQSDYAFSSKHGKTKTSFNHSSRQTRKQEIKL